MTQQKKKKWSKGRIKEKVNNQYFIDSNLYERILKEIAKDKLITPSTLTARFRISCSLAKRILLELSKKKIIKSIKISAKESIYTKLDVKIGL